MNPASRAQQYRRLLRWYSQSWRAEHGEAMLGILMDRADARGLEHVTFGERMELIGGGLRERFLTSRRPSGSNILARALLAVLSLFYLTIIWSPTQAFDGSVGPFSNPTVVTVLLVVTSFVLLWTPAQVVGRYITVVAVGIELFAGVLGHLMGWFGPSWSTVFLFTGLLILTVAPGMRTTRTIAAWLGVIAIVAAGEIGPSTIGITADIGLWALAAIVGALTVIVLVVGALATWKPSHERNASQDGLGTR